MKQIDHIGIAVESIAKTLPFYTDVLKFTYLKTEIVESEKVKVAFIDCGNCKIELLEPLSNESPIAKFLAKKGEGIHHIAIKTADILGDIRFLTDHNVKMINETPKRGAGGANIAFLHPKSTQGVLMELCEKE
ncbi:methylmalonyl-CoA epimerase [Bacillus kwashiorkori]|uniref:methylmalonyl-CoA epimerase n=1 Tax=Bacillus kwashiorkori TaxID=1522318 RepID=UPI0007804867|nr:methylmalonyl-CoA epimerase [Bacillus kwashiorkori]